MEPLPRGRLALAAAAAALVGLGALALHTRTFLLKYLVVTGARQLSAAEVEADLALSPGVYTWQLRPWVLTRALSHDPLIAKARVRLVWPDRLEVEVTERLPVALLLDGQTAWEVDAAQRLLRALPDQDGTTAVTVPGLGVRLPVIVGLHLPAPAAGEVLSLPVLARALAVAQSLGGTVGRDIAEVTVAGDGSVGVLTAQGVPVAYGDGSDAPVKTRTLLGILAAARAQGVRLASCDVSAPATPVCRYQPGSPPLTYPPPATQSRGA
jgi:cell division protein FtsQ